MTRCLLKSITDFDYTFHHLRHTAISRIYAVLEADDDLISVLSPYSAEDALKPRQAIHNVDESERYEIFTGRSQHSPVMFHPKPHSVITYIL